MTTSYKILYAGGSGEIEEKKSRFIAHTFPISTEEEAISLIAGLKKEYWDARHNCYAYVLGDKFQLQRYSDDGEPSGTAGKPILEVLLGQEIHNCLVVVTRYFGGTLLGTGGLVRAYQQSTKAGLAESIIMEKNAGTIYTIAADYSNIGRIQYLLASQKIPVLDSRFSDKAETDIIVTEDNKAILTALTDATSASALLIKGDPVSFGLADGELILL